MRALAITGTVTAALMPSIMAGSLMRATPPSRLMSAGTRSRAMTATAPASSAILACSGVTTSMITPPRSISASPRLTRSVPVCRSIPVSLLAQRLLSGCRCTHRLHLHPGGAGRDFDGGANGVRERHGSLGRGLRAVAFDDLALGQHPRVTRSGDLSDGVWLVEDGVVCWAAVVGQ